MLVDNGVDHVILLFLKTILYSNKIYILSNTK